MTTTAATDFDVARLRARRTNKWHKFPPDVLPAWVADMDFGVAPSIAGALARLTRDQEYGYAARDGVLAAAFVRRMERRFGWRTDPADTVAVGDLVQASFSSVMAFSEPGDAILLQAAPHRSPAPEAPPLPSPCPRRHEMLEHRRGGRRSTAGDRRQAQLHRERKARSSCARPSTPGGVPYSRGHKRATPWSSSAYQAAIWLRGRG